MSFSTDHAQLQRQLYLLGYSHALPADGVQLAGALLKDLQSSLDRVKELEAGSVRLERDERTARVERDKAKSEVQALRAENNALRVEVLGHAREADRARREARTESYRLAKAADDLRMANLQLKAESAERLRMLSDCQKKAEDRLSEYDPRGKIPRMSVSGARTPPPPPPPSATAALLPVAQPAIVDLVDLSSRRIAALEREIADLENALSASGSALRAAQLDAKARDLEISRLHSVHKDAPSASGDSTEVPRLVDQVDYLHERAEALERTARDREDQFAREKDELLKRWVAAENERASLAANPPPGSGGSDDLERVRTECANIKSLYAQTRDQLQALLREGNAEQRLAIDQARRAEEASQASVRELKQQLAAMPDYREQADARGKQLSALEERIGTYEAQVASLSDQLSRKTESQASYDSLVEQHRTLDKSLRQAVAEVGEWRAKADDREHRVGELTRRADEYKLLYRQASSELVACKKTLAAYTDDLATLRESHRQDQKEVGRLSAELDQALRLRQAVEMSKDEYKAGLAKALAESEAHRSLVAHLQAERSALRVQVKAQFHLSQRLEQRLETLDPTHSLSQSVGRPLSRSSSAAHSSRSFQ
ncbi:hypothetical protein GGI20_003633 [Coemansia sp. BCRC 34301]|nr:hypothetical protein GGI20_003633 [Coemansia sp. BCRC 34301]